MEHLPERIMIIAGNMDQYRTFRRHLADVLIHDMDFEVYHDDIRYIRDVDSIRGQSNLWGYRVGTWAERKDIEEVSTMLLAARSSIDNFIEVDM